MKGIAWGWKRPDGSFVVDSSLGGPEEAWQLALGWPTLEEIDAAEKEGWVIQKFSVEAA